MPRDPRERKPLEPADVKEAHGTERASERERHLGREEYVTDAYTPDEAVTAMPGKREWGDEDYPRAEERGNAPPDLAALPGVGPGSARDLAREGILSVTDLALADPVELAERMHLDHQVARRWVHAARVEDEEGAP